MNNSPTHEKCEPPEDNPKGVLKSIYYNVRTDTNPQKGIRIQNVRYCSTCHTLVKIIQEEF
ncbi:hypothetical protein LCGC14_1054810 [marine sediment metagenome]|uniref:Uncharacterized protein n=1 Tax=marine sediment metagenome TaxID=412755 RepID=A0A0F9MMU8_9ZZZZ